MKPDEIIKELCTELGLDSALVWAVAKKESGTNPWACRFEKNWKYFVEVAVWAEKLGQSRMTEAIQQGTSWGAMQVMGSIARELGFKGYLTQLAVMEIGYRYGCLKLKQCLNRFPDLEDAISAYNAGTPKKLANGDYINQAYVEDVVKNIK